MAMLVLLASLSRFSWKGERKDGQREENSLVYNTQLARQPISISTVRNQTFGIFPAGEQRGFNTEKRVHFGGSQRGTAATLTSRADYRNSKKPQYRFIRPTLSLLSAQNEVLCVYRTRYREFTSIHPSFLPDFHGFHSVQTAWIKQIYAPKTKEDIGECLRACEQRKYDPVHHPFYLKIIQI